MIKRIEDLFGRFFKKPMKVGLVTYNYPIERAEIAGSSMHSYNLSRNLAELGCEVHVFCSGPKDKVYKEKIGEGKFVIHSLSVEIPYSKKKSSVVEKLHWYTFETRALNYLMWENSKRWFDIIHSQGYSSTAFMLKHFSNMKWIHTFHSLSRKRLKKMTAKESKFIPVHDWIEKTVVDADKVVVVSHKFREEVIREIKGIARNTVVISNGVNLDLFNPSKKSPLTVLYVGRFSKEKGIDLIPEIAEKVLKKDKKYKFIVVATKPDLQELIPIQEKFEELLKQYPQRFIWHHEPLHEKEIAELYQQCGVYFQPSTYETFGMCVLEAMASGRAVVGTKVGGIPEVIGNAGLLAKPEVKDITKKILKLLGDSKLRKKYGSLAVKRAQEFDWKRIAQKTLDMYHEVIEENKDSKKK